jgi:hypothetical protein
LNKRKLSRRVIYTWLEKHADYTLSPGSP